jgi:hypothetical protein
MKFFCFANALVNASKRKKSLILVSTMLLLLLISLAICSDLILETIRFGRSLPAIDAVNDFLVWAEQCKTMHRAQFDALLTEEPFSSLQSTYDSIEKTPETVEKFITKAAISIHTPIRETLHQQIAKFEEINSASRSYTSDIELFIDLAHGPSFSQNLSDDLLTRNAPRDQVKKRKAILEEDIKRLETRLGLMKLIFLDFLITSAVHADDVEIQNTLFDLKGRSFF